jgi:hypothetical protein
MKHLLAIIILALCAGCTTLDLTTVDEYGEGAFQAEHLVDVIQSTHGAAEDPCFSEGDPVTRAITGAHPSQGAVLAWGVGYGALHYGITALLLDNGHDKLAAIWEAASIIDTASVIDHNYSVGIRIGAPNKDDAACLAYYHGNIPTIPSNFHLSH